MAKHRHDATTAPTAANDSAQGYAVGSTWFRKDNGTLFECFDATPSAARWAAVAMADYPWPPGELLPFPAYCTTFSANQCVADLLTMVPIVLRHRRSISGIGVRVSVQQAGAAIRLGLYASDPDTGRPAGLVADAGELTLNSGGNRTKDVAWDILPGRYYIASLLKPNATLATVFRIGSTVSGALSVADGADPFTSVPRYLSAALPYGALPANAPAMAVSTGSDGVATYLRRTA